MKKLYLDRFLKFIALVVPIAAFIMLSQQQLFFFSNHHSQRIREFYYEEPHSLDVVLLGASEIYTGFSPAYAYEQTGLTSYIYAFGANPGTLYLPELKEILSRQSPQLILVEPQGFVYDDELLSDETALRVFSENIPYSLNRIQAVLRYAYEDRLSCLLPFFKYHGQWQLPVDELKQRQINRNRDPRTPNWFKGVTADSGLDNRIPEREVASDGTTNPLDRLGESSLIAFLEYCRKNELENIVFVRFPHKVLTESQYLRFCRINRVEQIVNQYGYRMLNLERQLDEAGFDFEYDFDDPEHMNLNGQIKMTELICELLQDEYQLEPRLQTEENKGLWEKSVEYNEALAEKMWEMMEEGENKELYESPALLMELDERIMSWAEAV